jgi:hypothetical protein
VVIDTYTAASRCAAMGAMRSMSRSTPADLVIMRKRMPRLGQHLDHLRVMRSRRSTGW